jgi:type VI secretion system protein ImpC
LGAQSILNNWVQQYVNENESASEDDKAKFPLREARVEIVGRLGALQALAFVRPQFQLEDLSVPMRLMIDLPPTVKW